MNQNNPNLLFYSKKCKTCELFINTCHNNGVLKYLKLICIDDNVSSYSAKGLKVVPTLIIQGNNAPIEGKNVFSWLENLLNTIKINNNESPIINNNESPIINNKPLATNIVKRNVEEPVVINNSNVKNNNIRTNKNIQIIQDNNKSSTQTPTQNQASTQNQTQTQTGPTVKKSPFGYLKDEMDGFSDSFAYLMTDNPLPKSFTSVDKEQAIYTAPEGNKLDRRTQEMLIKTLENERVNEKNEIEKIYEMEHYNSLNK
jgi:hypothetical protein